MAETIISEHYNGDVKIVFYPNSHRYRLDTEKTYLNGVTTALGIIDKSAPLLIWAERLTQKFLQNAVDNQLEIDEYVIAEAINQRNIKLESAGNSGSLVHEWVEAYIKGQNPDVPADESVRNGVLGFLRWVKEDDVKFIISEKVVYSKTYGYVGTMDVIFTLGKEDHKILHAGDFKTGSGIYFPYALQASAYQHAYTEEFGTKFGSKFILRFAKEDKFDKEGNLIEAAGTFQSKEFHEDEHEDHFNAFISSLNLFRASRDWDKLHGYYSKTK